MLRLTVSTTKKHGQQNRMIFFRLRRCLSGFLLVAALVFASVLPAGEGAQSLDLSAYRGKVVVVDFWASWCAPCRRSMPWLDSMQQKYGDDGLVVIGVNEDNAAKDAEAFLKDFPVSFQIVSDRHGSLAREFDLIAMPSTYVIGRDGEVAVRHLGFKSAKQDEYETILRRLLDPATAANEN